MIALLEHLGTPSVEVGTAFKRVIRDVRERTRNLQSPQIVSNLATEFYFHPGDWQPTNPDRPEITVGSGITDLEFWKSIEDTHDVNLLRAYLVAFPRGNFVEVAKDRIAKLEEPAPPSNIIKPPSRIKKTSKPKATVAPPPKPKPDARTRSTAADVRPAPTAKSVASEGRCRDGNIERCRRNCREGRRGACAMLRRLEGR